MPRHNRCDVGLWYARVDPDCNKHQEQCEKNLHGIPPGVEADDEGRIKIPQEENGCAIPASIGASDKLNLYKELRV
jgi:hypothetical protein